MDDERVGPGLDERAREDLAAEGRARAVLHDDRVPGEHRGDDALAVFNERQQQVHGLQLGVTQFGSARLRLLDRLLRFHGEFVKTNGHKKPLLADSFQILA